MSPLIPLQSGMMGNLLTAPIFNSNRELIGTISVIFEPSQVLNGTTAAALAGTPSIMPRNAAGLFEGLRHGSNATIQEHFHRPRLQGLPTASAAGATCGGFQLRLWHLSVHRRRSFKQGCPQRMLLDRRLRLRRRMVHSTPTHPLTRHSIREQHNPTRHLRRRQSCLSSRSTTPQ